MRSCLVPNRHIWSPRFPNPHVPVLARRVSRCEMGSHRHLMAKRRLLVFRRKISNRVNDARHKMTTELAQNHGRIVVEKLALASLTRSARGHGRSPRQERGSQGSAQPLALGAGPCRNRPPAELQARLAWRRPSEGACGLHLADLPPMRARLPREPPDPRPLPVRRLRALRPRRYRGRYQHLGRRTGGDCARRHMGARETRTCPQASAPPPLSRNPCPLGQGGCQGPRPCKRKSVGFGRSPFSPSSWQFHAGPRPRDSPAPQCQSLQR